MWLHNYGLSGGPAWHSAWVSHRRGEALFFPLPCWLAALVLFRQLHLNETTICVAESLCQEQPKPPAPDSEPSVKWSSTYLLSIKWSISDHHRGGGNSELTFPLPWNENSFMRLRRFTREPGVGENKIKVFSLFCVLKIVVASPMC